MIAESQTVDLTAVLRPRRTDEGRFVSRIPDGWQQGRGAFGGLVLGLLASAMEATEANPLRVLRSLAGEILTPVLPEEAEISVEILRRGKGLDSFAARLRQDGEIRAHASALFGKNRVENRELSTPVPPAPPPWEAVDVLPVEPPLGPSFARWFEYRATGPLPFGGGAEPRTAGWIRAKQVPEPFGVPELIAYADAWWPTLYTIETAPRPMATVGFTFQLCADPATLDPTQPLFFQARALAAHDGFVAELRELWSPDGRLVAVNPQTFAIIR